MGGGQGRVADIGRGYSAGRHSSFEPGEQPIDAVFLPLVGYKGKGSGILRVNGQGEAILGGGVGGMWVHIV